MASLDSACPLSQADLVTSGELLPLVGNTTLYGHCSRDPDGDDTIVIPNSQPASGIVDCSDTTDEDGTVILWDLVAIG